MVVYRVGDSFYTDSRIAKQAAIENPPAVINSYDFSGEIEGGPFTREDLNGEVKERSIILISESADDDTTLVWLEFEKKKKRKI